MATPNQVSALSLIKNHLLDEVSPMPTISTNQWINESLPSESTSHLPIFGSYTHQTGFEFSEFETKPEIIDLVTPKFTNSFEFESVFYDFELKPTTASNESLSNPRKPSLKIGFTGEGRKSSSYKMTAIKALFFLFCFLVPSALAQLQFGFYDRSCTGAESIVANVVANRFRNDRSIAAALLRMQFHDCFVRGCDASLLIDPRPGRPSEKSTGPNSSVRGYEIIDEAKRQLEIACPRKVSCADIVTIATRDAVVLAGGLSFKVPTGRRDGLRSSPSDVNLPGPGIPVAASVQLFANLGMSVDDMVTLIGGGHSVGVAHCSLFQDRLADPAMDRTLNARLRNTCRSPNDPTVFLDQRTPFTVDNAIYGEIRRQRGILRIDQNLGLDRSTSGIVSSFASNNALFRQRFAQAMVKMGRIGVLTGASGEIRRNCRAFNNGS